MNLETLQSKTDRELDHLAAIHILWGGIRNGLSEEFVPTSDMTCVRRLEDNLSSDEFYKYTEELLKMVGVTGEITKLHVHRLLRTTPRNRTMAAIMAKLGGG